MSPFKVTFITEVPYVFLNPLRGKTDGHGLRPAASQVSG